MPTKRLPWFKVWVGATRHEKVATLSDTDFRTWVELLDAASQQNERGRFESLKGAVAVTRRPVTSIKRLIAAGLLDDRGPEGLWLHDWQDWQRWRPEDDANGSGSTQDEPTNHTRSTRERLVNNTRSTPDQLTIVNGTTPERPSRTLKTEKEIKDGDVNPPASPAPRGRTAAAMGPVFTLAEQSRINAVTQVLEPFGISHEPGLWRKTLDAYGGVDLEVEAIKQADWMCRHKIKACSTARYLAWLQRVRNDARPGPGESEFVVEYVPGVGRPTDEPEVCGVRTCSRCLRLELVRLPSGLCEGCLMVDALAAAS